MAGLITESNNPNAIPTMVAMRTLARLKADTIAAQIGDTSYSNEVAQQGDTINVPIPAEYSSELLPSGGAFTRQNPNLGNAQISLSNHRVIAFTITDVNEMLSTPNLQNTNMGQAVANMAEDIDEDLLSIYTSFTTTPVGAYAGAITEAIYDSAETALFDERVGKNNPLTAVVTGKGYSDLRQLPRFTEHDSVNEGKVPAGTLGKLLNTAVFRDQKTNVTSGTNRHGILMAPAALLIAFRPMDISAGDGTVQVIAAEDGIALRLTNSYLHEVFGNTWSIDTLYGFTSGRTNHGIEIKH